MHIITASLKTCSVLALKIHSFVEEKKLVLCVLQVKTQQQPATVHSVVPPLKSL